MVRVADDHKAALQGMGADGVTVQPTGASVLWSDFNKANLDAMVKNKTVLQERKEQMSSALQGADSKPKDPQAAYNAARVYARLGDADQALTWLNKALDLGYDQFDYLSLDPSLVNLKKDPRFMKLLEERRPCATRHAARRGGNSKKNATPDARQAPAVVRSVTVLR